MKLAEALDPELPPERAKEVIEEYLSLYNGFYLQNMRKKLGLLKKEEPEDELLVTDLLQTMHNTGGVALVYCTQYPCWPLEGTVCHGRFLWSDPRVLAGCRCRLHQHFPLPESDPLSL